MFNGMFCLQTHLVTWQSMSNFLGQSLNHSLIVIFIDLRPHHDLFPPNGGNPWVFQGNPRKFQGFNLGWWNLIPFGRSSMAAGSKIKRICATRIYEKRVEAWRAVQHLLTGLGFFLSKPLEPQQFKGNLLNIISYLWEFLPQTAPFLLLNEFFFHNTWWSMLYKFAGLFMS